MAQSVEHIVHIDGVTGSSPVATTISKSGKLLAGLFLFPRASSSFTPMEVQSRRPLCGIQAALNGSNLLRPPCLSPASCLPGFFFFPASSSFTSMEVQSRRPLCGIQAALNGSSPVATTISKSGKLLAGLFLFLFASSFTPMEVQSRRPLCGIQAALNGSSPVATTMSGSASCLPGFFFFSPLHCSHRWRFKVAARCAGFRRL